MSSGLLIRLRPTGPWRIGPDSGDRDRVDRIYHSDSLYSAVTGAMARLGTLEEWLGSTVRAPEPAVRFSSCFPVQGDTLFVAPPRNLWPAPASAKVRWKGARFVPLGVVESLVAGRAISDDGWTIDGASETLVASGAAVPFVTSVRASAAVYTAGATVCPRSNPRIHFTPGNVLCRIAPISYNTSRAK